ncbi:MAG: SUMF1/EgtB/PvdO family nonheme iron enzyme, partial [Bacteroidota bacterium]
GSLRMGLTAALFIQEGNTAFQARRWAEAKRAYQAADQRQPSDDLKVKIQQCEEELTRDQRYRELLRQALDPNLDLPNAGDKLRQAQQQRDTKEVRYLIGKNRQLQERYSGDLASPTPSQTGFGDYQDPLAGDLVAIQGGSFMMGSEDGYSDETPIHRVRVSDFYLGKYEVTQAQWTAIMGSNPSSHSGCAQCPVEQVSWDEVQEFIKKLNARSEYTYRLPTEAEWEYAAGGGASNRTKWAGTNQISELYRYANFCDQNCSYSWKTEDHDDGYAGTAPVGSYQPNQLGLYDLSGNVWEWCQDWYGDYPSAAQTNPKGPSTGSARVARGGSWRKPPSSLRVAHRGHWQPDLRGNNLGFRLARTP